jgi:hypothetical protein
VTVAAICSVALAPAPLAVRLPTVQTPLAVLYTPWLGLAEANWNPAGSGSLTCTPVAAAGPLFVAVTVNVTAVC